LSILVVGLICVLMLTSAKEIPAYLLYLLFLVLGHFFAAHGHTISPRGSGHKAPLYLPSGFLRLLIMGMLVATVAYEYSKGLDQLKEQLSRSVSSITDQPLLPFIMVGGFFLGVLLHLLVGRENTPYWFEDIEAWVALLAVIGLCIDAIVCLVINPSMKDPLSTNGLEAFVAAAVAFYFGARS
jgi:hypothetical protein